MADIDFSAMQSAFEARQRKAAQPIKDAATHNDAQGLLDHAQTLAKGGIEALKNFGEGVVKSSPPSAAYEGAKGNIEEVSGITGAIEERLLKTPGVQSLGGEEFIKSAPVLRAGIGAINLVHSAAEFWGFGKVAGLAGEALEAVPGLSKLSTPIAAMIRTAAKRAGMTMGDTEAAVIGRRVLASSVVGGAATGTFTAAEGAIRGKPQPLGPNVALGMIVGGLAGAFEGSPEQSQARKIDHVIRNRLSGGERADVMKFRNLATNWGKTNGYDAVASMRRMSRVLIGKGSDVDRISIQQLAESAPELFEGKLNQQLAKAASNGRPQIEVPTPQEMATLDAHPEEADLMMGANIHPEELERMVESSVFDFYSPSEQGATAALRIGPQTLAGTMVRSDATTFVLPVGNDPKLDIPAAPKLAPPNLTTGQKAIHILARGSDWDALDDVLTKNQKSLVGLGKMVVNGQLTPDHVIDPEVAATVSSHIRNIADDLPKEATTYNEMLQEHANAFDNRAAALRGSETRPDNMFVREPGSGDILTVTDAGNGKTSIVDKNGRAAIVDNAVAPSHVLKASLDDILHSKGEAFPEETPAMRKFLTESREGRYRASKAEAALADRYAREKTAQLEGRAKTAGKTTAKDVAALKETEAFGKSQKQAAKEAKVRGRKRADLRNANDLKALEAALNGKEAASIEPPPTPGAHPIAEVLRDRISKLEKGAITIPRGKKIVDGLDGMLAEKLGFEYRQTPEGFVVRNENGVEAIYPTRDHAFSHMRDMVTALKQVAEPEAVVEKATAHLDEKATKKLLKAGRKAERINLPDIRKAADIAKTLNSFEGAEKPPLMQRLLPLKDPASAIRNKITRQHAALMTMGKGGEMQANLAKQFGEVHDMMRSFLERRIYEPMALLRKMGYTVEQMENQTAPKEAVDLYKATFLKAADEMYDTAQHLGDEVAPRIEGKLYAHHSWDFKPDTPGIDQLLPESIQMGVADNREQLAAVLNDPESEIPQPKRKADLSTYALRMKWAREKSVSIAHALESERRGNVGYNNDLLVMAHRYVNQTARRVAEIATYGPKNEAIVRDMGLIEAQFGRNARELAESIVSDVRGRVYIPMGSMSRMWGAATKMYLGASGSKHLFQQILLPMRFGYGSYAKATLETLSRGVFFGENAQFSKEIGAAVGWTGQELGDYPDRFMQEGKPESIANLEDWARKAKLPRLTDIMGKAGTAGLHVMLNFGRINAVRVARNVFPKYLAKAIAGDADALSVMRETLHSNVTPEALAAMDRGALEQRFAKNISDFEGMTYRPDDYPMLSRSQIGRELTRFRVFHWNLFHNVFNELNNPNFSYARRAKAATRLLIGLPVLGSADSIIRHHLHAGNINSEVAYDAWDRWTNDTGNVGKAIYMLVSLAITNGAAGVATDYVQGFNLRNQTLMERAGQLSPAMLAPVMQSSVAMAHIAHATLKGNPREKRRAYADLANTLSPPLVSPIERAAGMKKPVRLPKEMIYREALRAGP